MVKFPVFYGYVIDNPSQTLGEKIRTGVQLFIKKFGQSPTLCQVHVSQLQGPTVIDGVRVVPVHTCLPCDFLFTDDLQEPTQLQLIP